MISPPKAKTRMICLTRTKIAYHHQSNVPPQPVLYPRHDGRNGKISGSADAILLYDFLLPYSMKEISESHGKEMGGPWECFDAGWEAERVVTVTTRGSWILEQATNARQNLS